ncbi:hypothetical protein HY636_04370 [Candidatus Woesearchaeota archaeon]|nr:hypothetical protein [Candidatus Woesearchaeota archaeon]
MNKKGVIEIQFNWIFIFVVGTVILLFFVFIGKSYLENSNLKLAGKVLYDLDSIMKGATSSTKSASKLEIPNLKLRFTCFPDCTEEGCSSDFSMGDTGVNKPTPYQVIFAQEEINSDFLITWTLDWGVPFKVANFLYLTSPNIRYILVYKNSMAESKTFAEKIFALMSDNEFLNSELIEEEQLPSIEDQGHDKIRFVFFYQFDDISDKTNGKSLSDTTFDVLVLTPSFEGTAIFLSDKQVMKEFSYDEQKKIGYFGKEALVGAIFSEDENFFECNMRKSFNHLNRIYDVYRYRALYLAKYIADNDQFSHCSQVYNEFASLPDETIEYPQELTEDAYKTPFYSITKIFQIAEDTNNKAIINSCPRLY